MKRDRIASAAFLGIALALASGASAQDRGGLAVQNPPPQGRYAIYFGPFGRADVYLLDSETGRLWKPVTFTDVAGAPEVWVPQDRLDNPQQMIEWADRHGLKSD